MKSCKFHNLAIIITAALIEVSAAAVVPNPQGYVSNTGFTRLEFCQYDGMLYAFNGLSLFKFNVQTDSFNAVFASAGSATAKRWDPADFAFQTDSNNACLPTGLSQGFVFADIVNQTAQEKPLLTRNYYSTASMFRFPATFANGVTTGMNNTVYMVNTDGSGSETRIAPVSNANSGAIAFDYADNLYIADFSPVFDGTGLGKVNIYRINTEQISNFIEDNNSLATPELIVKNLVLAGSDSMVIDGNYNIYISSYVGIAKITPTADPNIFTTVQFAGNITANPHQGWPPPSPVFGGITADIVTGRLYYSSSQLNINYTYDPYLLCSANIEPAPNWSVDLNGDGIVDCEDLYLFTADYLHQGSYLKGDIKKDGIINLIDFAVFAGQWKTKAPWYQD